MDDPFSQLPRAAVLVYVGVLTAAASNTALAGQTEAEFTTLVSMKKAPPNDSNDQEVPAQPEPEPNAPTCGPACHDNSYQEQESPPPIAEKQGKCAVASEPEIDLALLGLGLSFGVGLSIAGRRRTRE